MSYFKHLTVNSIECYRSAEDGSGLAGDSVEFVTRESATGLHFQHQFADKTTKFFCKIFFAREFKEVRSLLGLSERDFLVSLTRCFKWNPHGGKSRSEFCRMADNRFILKQLSRAEASSVVEFLPHYMSYLKESLRTRRPSVMTRMVGVFRIGFRNSQTGRAWKQDVLVMENLFFSRNIARIFDLKGSIRSRYTHSTGSQSDVLLDENLMEYMCDSPFYVRDHSKSVLETALRHDTAFLARNHVMDYSLLVGIDMESKVKNGYSACLLSLLSRDLWWKCGVFF
jgi:1-phosphatidylinositol-3-phosphate 5-kinase